MSEIVSPADHPHATALRTLVKKYCREERATGRAEFTVRGIYRQDSILDDANSDARDAWGCYVIYDAHGRMRYVGMSKEAIGYRSISHFAKRVRESEFWRDRPPHYVDLIPTSQAWEAPSFEAYLTLHTAAMRNEPF